MGPFNRLAQYETEKVLFDNRVALDCDVADTEDLQIQGLSKHSSLEDGRGMIFPFDKPKKASFHMSSVQFPIDVIFVGDDNRVTKIVDDAQPGTKEVWTMPHTAYVVEACGGFCKANNIEVGSMFKKVAEEDIYNMVIEAMLILAGNQPAFKDVNTDEVIAVPGFHDAYVLEEKYGPQVYDMIGTDIIEGWVNEAGEFVPKPQYVKQGQEEFPTHTRKDINPKMVDDNLTQDRFKDRDLTDNRLDYNNFDHNYEETQGYDQAKTELGNFNVPPVRSGEKMGYFSKSKKEARRQARQAQYQNLSLIIKPLKLDETDVTAQNVSKLALNAVRKMLSGISLPSSPTLTYLGHKAKTAARGKITEGSITVYGEFRTQSGSKVAFDVPLEIHEGRILEPSIIVASGQPKIISQTAFDDLVRAHTMHRAMSDRAMYAPPSNTKTNIKIVPHNTRGMFSVSASADKLRRLVRFGAGATDEYLDPAERFDEFDVCVGDKISLKKEIEFVERGGVKHKLGKGTKGVVVRDFAGDNTSFLVQFDDGPQAVVAREFIKSGQQKPLNEPEYSFDESEESPALEKRPPIQDRMRRRWGPDQPGTQYQHKPVHEYVMDGLDSQNKNIVPQDEIPGVVPDAQVTANLIIKYNPKYLKPDVLNYALASAFPAGIAVKNSKRDPSGWVAELREIIDVDFADATKRMNSLAYKLETEHAQMLAKFFQFKITPPTKGKTAASWDHIDEAEFTMRYQAGRDELLKKIEAELEDMFKDGVSYIDARMAVSTKYGKDMATAIFDDVDQDQKKTSTIKIAGPELDALKKNLINYINTAIDEYERSSAGRAPAQVTNFPKDKSKPGSSAPPSNAPAQLPTQQPPAQQPPAQQPPPPPSDASEDDDIIGWSSDEPEPNEPIKNTTPAMDNLSNIQKEINSHPYYKKRYGQFFSDLDGVLSKPAEEQYKYIPRIKDVLDSMSKDPKSRRLHSLVKSEVAKLMKNMQPQAKTFKDKLKNIYREVRHGPEPLLWDSPESVWTPGGLTQIPKEDDFKKAPTPPTKTEPAKTTAPPTKTAPAKSK